MIIVAEELELSHMIDIWRSGKKLVVRQCSMCYGSLSWDFRLYQAAHLGQLDSNMFDNKSSILA